MSTAGRFIQTNIQYFSFILKNIHKAGVCGEYFVLED